jgi:FkbM family methyltransferase
MKEKIALPFINFARRHLRNTWVHRVPITSYIYKKVFNLTYGGVDKEITFREGRYLVPTTDTAVVPSMISGAYEKYELDLYKKLLKPGYKILDIGANIGVYCIEASKTIGAKGKVYAFEPVDENLKLLGHNLGLNNVKNVLVSGSAIGEKEDTIKIYTAKNSIATHSAGAISETFVEVPVTTIDAFVKKNNLKINLIKMDIEGYEGAAVEGGLTILKQQQPILFIEFSSHHLKQCNYDPFKHARNLLSLYQ